MQSAPKIFIALMIAALLTACPSKDGANSNSANRNANSANSANANSLKDDVDEFELTVKLPFHPQEVVWREENQAMTGDDRVPAPTDKKLTAVILFLKADAEQVVEQAKKYKAGAPETINTENWFPSELIAQSQTSGDETLKGTSYPAKDFFNPPYSDGKLTRIEGTDYFVLELYAK